MPSNKEAVKRPSKKSAKPKVNVQKSAAKKQTSKKATLNVPMYDFKGAKNGTHALPKEIFGAKINDQLMAQAVRVYLANQRQGNAHTKSRSEIKLTTGKWFRQKGTGRARHGAKSAPIFVGGGLAHGPKKNDYSLSFPKKMRKAALLSALSQKASDGEVIVISGLSKIEPKTKIMNQTLTKITADDKSKKKVLLVTNGASKDLPNVFRAGGNIKNLDLLSFELLNTYEVLRHKHLLLMKESVEKLSERNSKNNKN